ncbi:MAG: hypothetical protein KDD14_23280, partial [Saprospiraceae bacterium]|nr:hypothetical protein [Saprospiraceae bacterium]
QCTPALVYRQAPSPMSGLAIYPKKITHLVPQGGTFATLPDNRITLLKQTIRASRVLFALFSTRSSGRTINTPSH